MKVTPSLEWQLARRPFPAVVGDMRAPEIVLVVEVGGPIVAHTLDEARRGVEHLVELLSNAIQHPLDGPPRTPALVRVDDPAVGKAIQAAGLDIAVVVGPTPEIDRAVEGMREFLAKNGGDPTYLDEGRTEKSIRELFIAAKALSAAKPWRALADDDLLRVDIPALGVHGACLTVLGRAARSYGFLLFESDVAFEAFCTAGERAMRQRRGRGKPKQLDLGADVLSLDFQRGADLPRALREEIARHAWPVADAHAYPLAELRTRSGEVSFASERQLAVLTAIAFALGAFVFRHASDIADPDFVTSESITTSGGPTVTLTLPYGASDLFEPPPPPPARVPKVMRNAPCPCGSGKKYKKCHLEQDGLEREPSAATAKLPDAYALLVRDIGLFAERRFGEPWARQLGAMAPDRAEADLQLAVPWMAFGACVEGERIAARFEEAHRSELSRVKRALIAAELAAWMSIWRVVAVEANGVVAVEDLLTGEARRISDRTASSNLRPGEAVLARVIDYEGRSFFSGAHGIALGSACHEVAERVRKKLRRKSRVSTDLLRDADIAPFMVRAWVAAAANERAIAPEP